MFSGGYSIHGSVHVGVQRGGARRGAAEAAAAAHRVSDAQRGLCARRARFRAAAAAVDVNTPLYAVVGNVCTVFIILSQIVFNSMAM